MAEPITRPWEGEYTIENTVVVAEAPELRVVELTLSPSDVVPWHFHNNVSDTFFCLQGVVAIETRAPRHDYRLEPGESCEVGPKTAHRVSNGGEERCRFLVVQGIGVYDFVPVGGRR